MATTTYLSLAAYDQLDQAQRDIDHHIAGGHDGRCLTCREFEPCPTRAAASAVFARYGRLPTRRPGLASRGVR